MLLPNSDDFTYRPLPIIAEAIHRVEREFEKMDEDNMFRSFDAKYELWLDSGFNHPMVCKEELSEGKTMLLKDVTKDPGAKDIEI